MKVNNTRVPETLSTPEISEQRKKLFDRCRAYVKKPVGRAAIVNYAAERFAIGEDDDEGRRRIASAIDRGFALSIPAGEKWRHMKDGQPVETSLPSGILASPLFDLESGEALDLTYRAYRTARTKMLRLGGASEGRTVALGVTQSFMSRVENSRTVILTEGDVDTLAMAAFSDFAVVGVPGVSSVARILTALVSDKRILKARPRVILAFDFDKAGESAVETAKAILSKAGLAFGRWNASGFSVEGGIGDVTDFVKALGWEELKPSLAETEVVTASVTSGSEKEEPAPTWPSPIPLGSSEEVGPPEFPVAALGGFARDFVESTATALQIDVSVVAAACLGVISTLTSRVRDVVPRPGWIEPSNLFALLVLEPGARKSALMRLLTKPFLDVEKRLAEVAAKEAGQSEAYRQVLEEQRKQLTRKLSKCAEPIPGPNGELAEVVERLTAIPDADPPQFVANDVTPEQALELLAKGHGHLLVACAEGTILDMVRGRYSSGGAVNLDTILKAHAGDLIRLNRKDHSAAVMDPRLSMVLTVQPTRLSELLADDRLDGRGFLDRFLIVAPLSNLGHRRIGPPTVPDSQMAWFDELVHRWLEVDPSSRVSIGLSRSAEAALVELETAVEENLRPGGFFHGMTGFGGKFVGLVLRIAANLVLVEGFDPEKDRPEITRDLLARAEEIGWFFGKSYRASLHRHHGGRHRSDLEVLLKWIAGNREGFSSAECRARNRRLGTAKRIKDLLGELVDFGYVRPVMKPYSGVGRPPSPHYAVHPKISEFVKP